MILQAYGIFDYSSIQVSEFLKQLNMSHTVIGSAYNHFRHNIDGLSKEQPIWPIIVHKIKSMSKIPNDYDRTVLFVCDSKAQLSHTNLNKDLWIENRGDNIILELKQALFNAHAQVKEWKLLAAEPSTLDYVNSATKPSFVNMLQSALYKITPYALRREVQQVMIAYLAGAVSYTTMSRTFKSSPKLEVLSNFLHSQKAKDLRSAVLMLKQHPIEKVTKVTGFEQFELLYISKSSAKTLMIKDNFITGK